MHVQTYFKAPKENLSEREKQKEREFCHAAARYICQRCGMRKSTRAHHIKLRSHGGSDRAFNLLAVDEIRHDAIHASPEDSYREGWMCREFPASGDFHFAATGDSETTQ